MRALVLSGGGSHGAYENGALQWLLAHKEVKYDLLCGISVGALNCAVLSMFELGQEKAAARSLANLWFQISNKRIYKEHPIFKRVSALWKNSIVDSHPLLDFIDKKYAHAQTTDAKRQLIVGAVSLTTGKYEEFNQQSMHLTNAIKASSAYPVFFTPVYFKDQWWADGGIKEIAPVEAAVKAGATEIDLIIAAPADCKLWPDKHPETLDIALRVLNLTYEEILDDDLHLCVDKHPNVKIRILRPSQELQGSSVEFNQRDIIALTDLGFKDAQAMFP